MNIVNHVKKPFFEAPTARVAELIEAHTPFVIHSQPAFALEWLYVQFCSELTRAGTHWPDRAEYIVWARDQRKAFIAPKEMTRRYQAAATSTRPEALDADYGDASAGLGSGMDELEHAEAIVKAAHKLNEAKLAAGYSPLSLHTDDTAVAEAIRTVISHRQSPIWGLTPASTAVDLLLSQCDDEIDGAVLDALTMDLQRQLCAVLANEPAQEGGAA